MPGIGVVKNDRLLALSLLAVICAVTFCYGEKTECYVDDAGDKTDPNNIYKCAKDHTCCREEGKPSCCRKKESSVAIVEQATLWGILLGGILVLGLVMWFCRHDGDCCCNAKDGRKSCCGKAYGKKPVDNFAEGYGIPPDTDDDDDDDDENPKKKSPPPPAAAEKKPPPSPKKMPTSPEKGARLSPAKKHLPSPEKLPTPPAGTPQMALDDIP